MSCFGVLWSVFRGRNVTVCGETYRVVRRIGEGGFSYVELVHRRGHHYALKHMLLQVPEQREAAEAEIRSHSCVQHRSVVELVCSEVHETREGHSVAYLLFPYYQNGTLQDLIEHAQKIQQPLPERRVLQLMRSVCRALQAMHSASPQPLSHRDVKPANLLLTDSRDELVLMDLGSAAAATCTITNRQEALALQELCAQTCTAHYRAPELFEVPSECTITASSDIWSLGCCVFAAAFGQSPFDGSALASVSGRVNFPKQHPYSQELCELISWLLQVEPAHRPSAQEAHSHLSTLLSSSSNSSSSISSD